jgi:hypothetical protein
MRRKHGRDGRHHHAGDRLDRWMHGALPLAGDMSQFVLRETANRAHEPANDSITR